MIKIRAKEWAELEGITTQTVQRWCRYNTMPVPVEKVGRIWLVHDPKYENINKREEDKPDGITACYARVSTSEQRKDLDRQADRLKAFAINLGVENPLVIKEVASGMNENRSKLGKLLSDSSVTTIIVEHKNRFARINGNLIIDALKAQGRRVIILDDDEIDDNLVRDITEVMTSFCARFYGKRGARNRAKRALEAAGNEL